LMQGYELYVTGELHVQLANPDVVREFGEMVDDEASRGIYDTAEREMAAFEGFFKHPSALPEEPSRGLIDLLLRKARVDNLLQDLLNSY